MERRAPAGFTVIELLVALAILALLGTLVVPVAERVTQRRQEQDLRRALREIRQGIDAYKRAGDEGRIARAVDASGYPASLALLVDGVPDQRDPKRNKIYFLRRLPPDPFMDAAASNDGPGWGLRSYASEADDPQPGADVYDVYSLSGRTGLNDVPYRKW